jgi:hypothetical protein
MPTDNVAIQQKKFIRLEFIPLLCGEPPFKGAVIRAVSQHGLENSASKGLGLSGKPPQA